MALILNTVLTRIMEQSEPERGTERRKICSSCHQELGSTAYYRHQRDLIGSEYPGKRLTSEEIIFVLVQAVTQALKCW